MSDPAILNDRHRQTLCWSRAERVFAIAWLVAVVSLGASPLAEARIAPPRYEGAPPEPAEKARNEAPPAQEGRPPEPADESPARESPATAAVQDIGEAPSKSPAGPRELLEMYGVDASNFLVMIDGEPKEAATRLAQLLRDESKVI